MASAIGPSVLMVRFRASMSMAVGGISGLSAIDPTAGFRRVFAHALLGRRLPGEQGQDGGQRHGDSGRLERHSHRPFVFETGDRSETGLYERAC